MFLQLIKLVLGNHREHSEARLVGKMLFAREMRLGGASNIVSVLGENSDPSVVS